MKNTIKKIFILITFLCIIPIRSLAATAVDDIVQDGDNFLNKANQVNTVINETELQDFSSDVYNLILSIGMVIAVAVGMVLGIQFMISSVEEKAKIKELLVAYFIGCIVLFGAFTIWKIVIGILGTV